LHKYSKFQNSIIILFIIVFSLILLRSAWLSDDAFITFRTVDNFVNGWGLRWNIDERVQVYTHPFWMFLLSACYFFTHEIYYTSIFLSIAITLASVILISHKIARSYFSALIAITILLCSKAFIDYSTSGLENPLTNLLFAVFFIAYISSETTQKKFFFLCLIASLSAFNRMDTILFSVPALIYEFIKLHQPKKSIITLLKGFSPFILWELFSIFYYGFPFPNTAYAKLSTGITALQYIKSGFLYFKDSAINDPVTLLVIISTSLIVLMKKEKKLIPILLGTLLYLIYVVKIGGDFMGGRYFNAPLFSVVVIASTLSSNLSHKALIPIIILIIFICLISPNPTILSGSDYGLHKKVKDLSSTDHISDERMEYFQETGLFHKILPQLKCPNLVVSNSIKKVDIQMAIGRFGFNSGPKVHIVDILALSDPLLARLPVMNSQNFWIGHFTRRIPPGYIETLELGVNRIENKKIALFYDKLSIITRGKIFNLKRLWEIFKMNMGFYNYLTKNYYIPPKLRAIY
jgi:arabinofuranosyltransferase